jgi:hypothetical protein
MKITVAGAEIGVKTSPLQETGHEENQDWK